MIVSIVGISIAGQNETEANIKTAKQINDKDINVSVTIQSVYYLNWDKYIDRNYCNS